MHISAHLCSNCNCNGHVDAGRRREAQHSFARSPLFEAPEEYLCGAQAARPTLGRLAFGVDARGDRVRQLHDLRCIVSTGHCFADEDVFDIAEVHRHLTFSFISAWNGSPCTSAISLGDVFRIVRLHAPHPADIYMHVCAGTREKSTVVLSPTMLSFRGCCRLQ